MDSARMLDDLAALVRAESPSSDLVATRAACDLLDELVSDRLGSRAERHGDGDRLHLRWRWGTPRVLVLGHVDTVWPVGTLDRLPFRVHDGIATGPGVFDMKAGLVQGLHALARLDDLDGVALLVTSDEETGSATSRALVEETARGCQAVLVLEPSAGGALKSARKGVSLYDLRVQGRASHAGLEPERGINATVALARLVIDLVGLADQAAGTTVTPTVLASGTTTNTVPGFGSLAVDVRVADSAEQERVDGAIRRLDPGVPGAEYEVRGGPNRPPLPLALSQPLLARIPRAAEAAGVTAPGHVAVGGASDGNFTAGLGVPILDGLGAVGGGAHAEHEHVLTASLPERAALLRSLLHDLLTRRQF